MPSRNVDSHRQLVRFAFVSVYLHGDYGSVSMYGRYFIVHAGKILLKIIARRLSEYCERVGSCRRNRVISDRAVLPPIMVFVIRRLQELARKKRIPLHVCFNDLTKAYDSVDRTLFWTVLAPFGVPQNMISIIRQFRDSMRAARRQGVLEVVCCGTRPSSRVRARAPPVQYLFAAVINVASTRFKADKASWTLWYT